MAKVLMFHRVLPSRLIDSPNAYSTIGTLISQEYFEKVLSCLTANGFQFATVSELAKKNDSDRIVSLTFDDGYSDNFDFAFESLQKFKAKATFFPVVNPCKDDSVLPLDMYYQCVDQMILSENERTDFILGETKRSFYWTDPDRQPELIKWHFGELPAQNRVRYMNADQLRQLSDNQMEIGSHGMTHSLLTADYMDEKKVLLEMQNSKKWLETVTSKPVAAYCFPAGRYNARMIELAKQSGYASTCLVIRKEKEVEALPSHDRIFVKPDSLAELKIALEII